MTIFSARYTVVPVSLLPAFFSPFALAESEINDQTLIVSATPQSVSELDTPAAVSVVDGEDMRLATPRINLSESLTSVPGLQVQNRQNYAQDLQLSIVDLVREPLMVSAVFVCTSMVFQQPCRMDRVKHPISTLAAYKTLRFYAAPSLLCMAMRPAE